jgi:Aerobic-type carbon monoxide dehydrogenase, small subunit CoxS/CutS homologs
MAKEPNDDILTTDNEPQLSSDEEQLLDDLGIFGESRREFLKHVSVAGSVHWRSTCCPLRMQRLMLTLHLPRRLRFLENPVTVAFRVNGAANSLEVDSRMTLLDALRERLGLTGSKKGCDHGQCGACTVIVDGRRVLSCLTLTAQCEGKNVTTIEGLAKGNSLHPMQTSFVRHDGFQCGFCTPGQICSAVALMDEAKNGDVSYVTADVRQKPHALSLSDDEIRERMSGNICRCGAYPNIVDAIREVHTGKATDPLGQIDAAKEDLDHAAV